MPDVEENKTVDIDTSGPSVDIELENDSKETETREVETPIENNAEDKTFENEREVKLEENKEEPKQVEEKKENELEQYSDSVQRRIAKLTHKWREAERQKDEAAEFARAQIKLKEVAEAKISKLEPGFLKSTEDSS